MSAQASLEANATRKDVGVTSTAGETPVDGGSKGGKNAKGKGKAKVQCRFFGTKKGCRAGDSCPFYHDTSLAKEGDTAGRNNDTPEEDSKSGQPSIPIEEPKQAVRKTGPVVNPSRVVVKPQPKVDPRTFQLQQLTRRFSPKQNEGPNETLLEIQLKPSDPDFPFELLFLDCVLHVPKSYPSLDVSLAIDVRNKEMGRGYQINVERGFATIVASAPNGNLLSWMNTLDRKLEEFLTGEKAPTIKIVANRGKPDAAQTSSQPPLPAQPSAANQTKAPESAKPSSAPISSILPSKPSPRRPTTLTPEQISVAAERRRSDIRQLEARLNRVQGFARLAQPSGDAYTVPIEPRKRGDLPVELQSLKTLRLTVPQDYPLTACSISLQGVEGMNAELIEAIWVSRQVASKEGAAPTLMAMVNELAANMHIWVKEQEEIQKAETKPALSASVAIDTKSESESSYQPSAQLVEDADRPHLHYIPRPAEWDTQHDSGSDSDSVLSESESDEEHLDEGTSATEQALTSHPSDAPPPNAIALSFPTLQFHGIELLSLRSPVISAKCLRCKSALDLPPLTTTPSSTICPKCSTSITASFSPTLMHPTSTRSGYLTLDGATPVDLLPSSFIPTCSRCSTDSPPPGLTGVRGAEPRGVCRSCHAHFSFTLSEAKFLSLSSAAGRAQDGLPPRKPKKAKESLGITPGEPLPKIGRCKHYSKSYRWFRFGCCGKVYACDRCHDEVEGHPNERADRMICGWCSREQRFRAEECGLCGKGVVRKRGGGFWEGGKGTRDQKMMSRKDPRKFKRIGGGTKAKGKD